MYWWFIWWIWDNDGEATLATKEDMHMILDIIFRQEDLPSTVQRKNCYEAIEELGIKINPVGNLDNELTKWVKKSTGISKRTIKSSISPLNAYRLYKNIWLPSNQYPLAATTFSKLECLQIMKPFACALLPKIGFSCNIARKIIYGWAKYGSFQLTHLHIEQGHLAVKHLLGHLHEMTLPGETFMIALNKGQCVSRSGQPFLSEVKVDRTYVPTACLSNIRTFLQMCQATITVPCSWCPEPQQEFDSILMDDFAAKMPSVDTMDKLNRVQVYLGAMTL
eukprot:15337759-Ditylum_brightwellii.AAC.1